MSFVTDVIFHLNKRAANGKKNLIKGLSFHRKMSISRVRLNIY